MHRHECSTHNFLFDLENQTGFFLYYISYKKINVGKFLKLWENRYLIILPIHILKLEISGCDNRGPWGGTAQVKTHVPCHGPAALTHSTVMHDTDGMAARRGKSQCRAGTARPSRVLGRHCGHLY
jgi:hypothetical protein